MNGRDYSLHRLLHGAVLLWVFCNITLIKQVEGQTYPPPVGAGIVATLEADQSIYTNHTGTVSCPACVTNSPPCMLPCYIIGRNTAVARFSFQVSNQYPFPRTFQFPNGQQFDIELINRAQLISALPPSIPQAE